MGSDFCMLYISCLAATARFMLKYKPIFEGKVILELMYCGVNNEWMPMETLFEFVSSVGLWKV